MEQQHLRPPDTPQTAQGDSKHRLDERVDGGGEALAADAVTEGVKVGGRKVRLELRTTASNLHDAAASPAHRASAASLAETLPPPPAYETAISLPLPSSSASTDPSRSTRRRFSHRHRSHHRDVSVSSSSSSLSDPTSDSEDPLNDLLRLTDSLLATSTSILASSTALQGSLSRLLRSPPRGKERFLPHGMAADHASDGGTAASTSSAAEEEEEAATAATAETASRPASPSPAQSVEQSLRSELALSSFASDELDRLDRDVERYDMQRRGRDRSSLFLGGNREARAEKGRTMLVTAMAEGDGLGALGLGASPSASRRRETSGAWPGGGMKRSPSAAAELLGKLASSPASIPRSTGGMTRATSYAGGGLSAFLSSPSASPTPSSSKVTLDAPFRDPASPSLPCNATLPPTRRNHRRTSPLCPVASTPECTPIADLSSPSRPSTPLTTLPEAHLSPRPTLRRSPSTHDLRNPLPPSLRLAASLSTPSLLSSSSAFSTPLPSSPARAITTPGSTPRRPPARSSRRTNPSISLPRGSAALPTSISFEDLDSSPLSVTVGSPTKTGGEAASATGARERLKALAGAGAGAEVVKGSGGAQGEEGQGGGSWWSWT